LVESALHQGVVRCYGRELLRTHLRVAYQHHTREDDVRDALAHLDRTGTASRRKGADKGREGGEYITSRPDWLWCCDGHDKFRNFGIEIYACADAYSRRIQWCYVGNSNRRVVSILRQVATTVRTYNRCPSFFRSDKGKEVLVRLRRRSARGPRLLLQSPASRDDRQGPCRRRKAKWKKK
jgi:hypothetical protein